MVCMWRNGGHVGVQEQWDFSPLGVNFHSYANCVNKFSFVLYTNMGAMQATNKDICAIFFFFFFFFFIKGFIPSTDDVENEMIDQALSTKRAVALISCLLREHLCTNSPLYQSEAFYWRIHQGDNYVRRSFPQNRTCNEIIRAMAPFFLNFIKGFIPSTDDVEDEISDRPCLQKGPWR